MGDGCLQLVDDLTGSTQRERSVELLLERMQSELLETIGFNS